MKKLFPAIFIFFTMFAAFQLCFGDPCVEVDIELPETVIAEPGAFATGYFELTNCGDEAAVIMLAIDLDLNGMPFSIGEIPVPMGAGETISREFRMVIPPFAAGYTVTICITASSDTYEASDCATMTIEGAGGGTAKTFSFEMASEGECVEIDLELPDTVYAEPGAVADGYFELINCGDEAATIMLSVSIEMDIFDTTIVISDIPVNMGAGESISREFWFPVLPFIPSGTFGICITAVSGDAMMTTCQTIVIINEGDESQGAPENDFNLKNYPNPFNPDTKVMFTLGQSSHVNLTVYNLLGQKIITLVDGRLPAGEQFFDWNGRDADGSFVGSGIYFYKLLVEDIVVTNKMMIVK